MIFGFVTFGQYNPDADPNLSYRSDMSDEFDYLNLSLWRVLDNSDFDWVYYSYKYNFFPQNTYIEQGELVLMASRWSNISSYFKSGGIMSNSSNYSYGYYEIEALLPGYFDADSNAYYGKGLWPAFWTTYQEPNYPCQNCIVKKIWDEIDILEPSGTQYINANTNVAGVWDEYIEQPYGSKVTGDVVYNNISPLCLDYHKYGMLWTPNKIEFYFDRIKFGELVNDPACIMNPQRVVINLQLGDNGTEIEPAPYYMKVRNFKYYKFNINTCNSIYNITNSSQLSSYSMNIYGDINIGAFPNNVVFINSRYTFAATNSILLNGDLTIPVNCDARFLIKTCN